MWSKCQTDRDQSGLSIGSISSELSTNGCQFWTSRPNSSGQTRNADANDHSGFSRWFGYASN